MKICFFLQRRWVYIGHSMAYDIKKQFPETEFCGVVNMRTSMEFLLNQKDVHYTSLILDEDIHKKLYDEKIDHDYLRNLEKEYGIPNLWPYLYVDRVIMNEQLIREYPHNEPMLSHEEMMKRVQVTAKELIAFLDREKPDAVIISVVGALTSLLLWHIAKKKNIQTINIELTRVHNRIAFSESYKHFTWIKKRFDEIEMDKKSPELEHAKEFLHKFRDRPAPYHEIYVEYKKQIKRTANLRFLSPKKFIKSVLWHTHTFFKDLKKTKNNDYTDIFMWWLILDKTRRKLRGLRGYSDLYGKFDPNTRFAYYPLHYDPEMATMLYAPRYTDQVHLIKQIARSLPLDMKLYVKEHPAMLGYRPRSFYKEFLNVPNVVLIPPQENGHDLARAAAITITITSTGGWESVLFKKPVITFGDVYYNDVPGVKTCRSYDELPFLVKEQLEKWEHNEEQLINYISALLEDSVPADYVNLWLQVESAAALMENEGIKALSHVFAKKIGLKSTTVR